MTYMFDGYADGCYAEPHCLTCSLPQCIYDLPVEQRPARAENTVQQFPAMQAARQRGMSVEEIGRKFKVSRRTVNHALSTTINITAA
jgi:predicted DNA-binding protein (UPF0251 family)